MTAIRPASDPADIEKARMLFTEYAGTLEFDLGFQGFEDELRGLPGPYAAPRGIILLGERDGSPIGCVAVRPLSADVAELKRLFVRPEARGLGLGRQLTLAAIQHARDAGYRAIRLDTVPTMAPARALYAALGFRTIPPYRHNPVPGAEYLELSLPSTPHDR